MDTTRTDKTTEVIPPEITLIPPDEVETKVSPLAPHPLELLRITTPREGVVGGTVGSPTFKNNRIEFEFDNQKINAPLDNLEAVLANEMKLNHWKKLTKCCFRNNK